MKRYLLLLLIVPILSCGPSHTYRSKVESLQEYHTELFIKPISVKELNIKYWTAVKKEFPDYVTVIDTIMLISNEIEDMKEKDTLRIDDRIAFNKMVSDFWEKLEQDADKRQREFDAALLAIGNALNTAGQSLNAAQQQRYQSYSQPSYSSQPYRTPINCTSYRIGNTIRTTCY